MLIEALVAVVVALVNAVASLMPDVELPAFLDALPAQVSAVTGWMAPLGVWLPINAATTAGAAVLAAYGVALAIRLVRILASFFTGGGGSAA